MITFETEEPIKKAPTFGDVAQNQHFVNSEGFLCQKVSNTSYNRLANPNGKPYAWQHDLADHAPNIPIQRILPKVTKINF